LNRNTLQKTCSVSRTHHSHVPIIPRLDRCHDHTLNDFVAGPEGGGNVWTRKHFGPELDLGMRLRLRPGLRPRRHKLTGPGRTVWVVRTGRRAREKSSGFVPIATRLALCTCNFWSPPISSNSKFPPQFKSMPKIRPRVKVTGIHREIPAICCNHANVPAHTYIHTYIHTYATTRTCVPRALLN